MAESNSFFKIFKEYRNRQLSASDSDVLAYIKAQLEHRCARYANRPGSRGEMDAVIQSMLTDFVYNGILNDIIDEDKQGISLLMLLEWNVIGGPTDLKEVVSKMSTQCLEFMTRQRVDQENCVPIYVGTCAAELMKRDGRIKDWYFCWADWGSRSGRLEVEYVEPNESCP